MKARISQKLRRRLYLIFLKRDSGNDSEIVLLFIFLINKDESDRNGGRSSAQCTLVFFLYLAEL